MQIHNIILSSTFERGNKIKTVISNPTPRVACLMENISSGVSDYGDGNWKYIHSDIGTAQDMEKLFAALDNCA